MGWGSRIGTALLAQVLTRQLAGARIEHSHAAPVPLHLDVAADPALLSGAVGRADSDTAIQVHPAVTELVTAEGLDGRREQSRFLPGEHGTYLAPGGTVDAGGGPVLLPAIELGPGLHEVLETQAFERGIPGVSGTALHFASSLRVADAARQGDGAAGREQVAIERVEIRSLEVGLQHALPEVFEEYGRCRAAPSAEGILIRLGPGAGAAVAAQARIADHGAGAAAGLGLLTRWSDDDGATWRPRITSCAARLKLEIPGGGVRNGDGEVRRQVDGQLRRANVKGRIS